MQNIRNLDKNNLNGCRMNIVNDVVFNETKWNDNRKKILIAKYYGLRINAFLALTPFVVFSPVPIQYLEHHQPNYMKYLESLHLQEWCFF